MKILVALSRFPYPIDKGDKLRAYYQIRGLSKNHEIHLVCLNEGTINPKHKAEMEKYCKSIQVIPLSPLKKAWNLFGGLFNKHPFQVNYFKSSKMRKAIEAMLEREKVDLIYVQLIRLAFNIPFKEGIPCFLDYMDAFSVGMENRVKRSGGIKRRLEEIESRRLRDFEKQVAVPYEGFSIISEQDAAALPPLLRDEVLVVPNGVGESFLSEGLKRQQGGDWEFDFLFSGNMGYHHNVEAARFLVEKVVPELEKSGLKPTVCLAGARPAPAVRALASDRVTVTGFVEDIREYFHKSRFFVAPLVSGQGLQNKLLESMAMGMPTLTSPLANAALKASPGIEILVCANEIEFARDIIDLMQNPQKAAELAIKGREFVKGNYDWEASNRILEAELENLLRIA